LNEISFNYLLTETYLIITKIHYCSTS